MKILYIFGVKTKKLSNHNIFQLENLLEAYELLIDLMSESNKQFSDKEIKNIFSSDGIIDLHDGESIRIIHLKKNQNALQIANEDFEKLLLAR